MALRKSTKIAIGFALIVGVSYGSYQVVTTNMAMSQHFEVLTPGNVNLVGIDPGAGYRIIVANHMAQLVQASDNFGGTDSAGGGGATDGAIKRRVPMKEMMNTLKGDQVALGRFVMSMNDMKENDNWPPVHVMWKAEDIQKALDGDKKLEANLVRDLNMKLDGTPLSSLRFASLENGIIIDSPVSVEVNLQGKVKTIVGRVYEPYRPRLMKAVEARYQDKANVTRELQAGYYSEEAGKMLADPRTKEDVRDSLSSRISKTLAEDRAAAPTRLLRSATVVLNDALVSSASYDTYDSTDGKRFDLKVEVTEEGRRRLWQYTKKHTGMQLLLIADGIPIEAPRIDSEIAQSTFTISQMRDEVLVRDAVEMLNNKRNVAQK